MEDEAATSEHEIGQVRGCEKVCNGHVDYYPDCDTAEEAYPEALALGVEGETFDEGCYCNEDCACDESYDEVYKPPVSCGSARPIFRAIVT